MLVSYKNRKRIEDDYGKVVILFFNEDFIDDIMPLMSSYRHHKMSRVNQDDKRKAVFRNGIVQLKESMQLLDTNYKLDIEKFVAFGQDRKKNWDYMGIEEFDAEKHIIPMPKKKFMNLRKRRRQYVISK